MILYIFSNQLYEVGYLRRVERDNGVKISEVYLVEDPVFYGMRKNIVLRLNLIKLVYQRLALLEYYSYLKGNGYKVRLFNIADIGVRDRGKYPLDGERDVIIFDVVDHELRLRLMSSKLNILWVDTPNFVLTRGDINEYREKVEKRSKGKGKGKGSGKVRYSHTSFYGFVKEKIGVLRGVRSYDKENRCKLPDGIYIPDIGCDVKTMDMCEVRAVVEYIDRCGYRYRDIMVDGVRSEIIFPYDYGGAKRWFGRFMRERLGNFGRYEDAISVDNNFVFHSCITPMLNLGLLHPDYLLGELEKYRRKHNVKMNNYEGYIRQLIGWREYQRFIYEVDFMDGVMDVGVKFGSYFGRGQGNMLSGRMGRVFYRGETGVPPIDDAIHTAFRYGYLHHIMRLMVIGNFMTLCRVSPMEQYRWFMEFSLDSYDWVMYQNILMISYADGGMTMRKPYLSSSNYIMRMSDYVGGEWEDIWDGLFYIFLVDNRDKIRKTIYIRNLRYWDRLSDGEKRVIRGRVGNFMRHIGV